MRVHRWIWVLGIILLLGGLFREETRTIMVNARMLCFSCIGID